MILPVTRMDLEWKESCVHADILTLKSIRGAVKIFREKE
jgi:hypothetical protein